MIKIIGAIFLIGGATIMGMGASAALTSREKSLKGFLEALHIMHSEIGERLTPIDELMKILAETA
ncbi:MAG: stage III sporulation protein AB, partial [Oscillospiraceae bacterium]|nr:stage III sporulation protein AB [Oscillospiraceae bacterium]